MSSGTSKRAGPNVPPALATGSKRPSFRRASLNVWRVRFGPASVASFSNKPTLSQYCIVRPNDVVGSCESGLRPECLLYASMHGLAFAGVGIGFLPDRSRLNVNASAPSYDCGMFEFVESPLFDAQSVL